MLDSNVIDILTFHFNLTDKIWRNDWQLQEETRYVHVILIQFGVVYVNIYKGHYHENRDRVIDIYLIGDKLICN